MMKKLPAKEVYKRLKFKESIQKKIAVAKKRMFEAEKKLEDIENSCPHYDSEYKNRGSSGNWDKDENYWREYECHDCGKRWTTDQSLETDRKHPYAVNKTYK